MMRRSLEWGGQLAEHRPTIRGQGPRLRFLIVFALFLAVLGWLTGFAATGRGQAVLLLGWVLAALFSTHRANGAAVLARRLLEYATVGIFAALLTLTIAVHPSAAKPQPHRSPHQHQTAGPQGAQVAGVACSQLERVRLADVCQRLSQVQRRASTEAGRRLAPPSTTTPRRHR
jgi:hypothetical protein